MIRLQDVLSLSRNHPYHYFVGGKRVLLANTSWDEVELRGETDAENFAFAARQFWAFATDGAPDGTGTFSAEHAAGLIGVSPITIRRRIADGKIVPVPGDPTRISQPELERFLLYRNTYPFGHRVNDCQLPGM